MCKVRYVQQSPWQKPEKQGKNNIVKVEAYNCRGIKTDKKRNDFFGWLKPRNSDITILGDTHCHLPKEENNWRKQWCENDATKKSSNNYSSFWSKGTKARKGVAILFSPSFRERVKVIENVCDSNGRFVKLVIQINEVKYRILAIYAPNDGSDRINFIKRLHDILKDQHDAETIVGGDHNIAMNDLLDRVNCVSDSNDIGRIDLQYLAQTHDLEDIWRTRNPGQKQYTWFCNKKASRIDYFLTSVSLNNQINLVKSHYNPYSDHHGIRMTFRTNETVVGKGLWKMNNEIILTQEFKQRFLEMWTEWQGKKDNYQDVTKWWDLGKMKIKTLAQNFSIEKSIERKNRLQDLESEITNLENSMADPTRLAIAKNELFGLKSKEIEGARVRSRLKWWEEGEQSTKYFHSLERRNGKQKAWDSILDENKQMVRGTNAIQDRQVRFYKDLFTSQNLNNDNSFFLNNPTRQLSDLSKNELERDISHTDICRALKLMPNNKSPGEDGISIEFYKTYWNIIGHDLHEVFIKGLNNRELSYSQYLAAISLLYKKGPREDIKNWRPISLLNVDYKILSKVLSERLKKVLPEIIHTDQKGAISGRYIGENIRLLEDLLFEIDNLEEESIIFLQDQEKAFDRVEWEWLFSSLRYFNFGDIFISWIKTMYKGARSCILTNGMQSSYFKITRGIRQGDSLSALLYIIQLEPLAEKIRKSNTIEGIKIKLKNMQNEQLEVRCCHYVDDSNTFLKNKNFIDSLIDILNKYENVSGSKINLDKTVALAIRHDREEIIKEITLRKGPEKVLGVPIGGSDLTNNDALWESLISKLRDKLNIWITRNLSLQGKTHIIRSIGVSKVLFAIEMKTIDEKYVKEINNVIWKFLWSGKDIRFNRDICTLPRNLGGLGLVDVNIIIKVKRINWIIRVLKDDGIQAWSKLIESYLRCLDNQFSIKLFALKVTDSSELTKKASIPLFYKECLNCFQELSKIARVEGPEEFIWCNHRYLLNNKPISYSSWSRDGINRPSHLYNNGILDPVSILNRLTHRAGFFFEFHTMRKMFPLQQEQRADTRILENYDKRDILEHLYQMPDGSLKSLESLSSRDIYSIFLHKKSPIDLSKIYWKNKFAGRDINWESWSRYNLENKLTPRNVLDFNFRIRNNLINVETRLQRMNYSDGKCSLCQLAHEKGQLDHVENENLEHLLINCLYKKKIWRLIDSVIKRSFGNNVTISKFEVLCGVINDDLHSNDVNIISTLIAMSKWHLYLMRNITKNECKEVTFIECCFKLRYYLSSHIKLLIMSKKVKQDVKDKLEEILLHITNVIWSGINENNIFPLELS